MNYLQILSEENLPTLSHLKPFKCVLVIEHQVSVDAQSAISEWLVESGCMYMMAWGLECSSWDDSVDYANLEHFNYEDIPDESSVITTWHEKEPIEDVIWYSKYSALHEFYDDLNMVFIHLGFENKSKEYASMYFNA